MSTVRETRSTTAYRPKLEVNGVDYEIVRQLDVVELCCGIGGAAAGMKGLVKVGLAVDIDELAATLYRTNNPGK